MEKSDRTYVAIDLKSFYASVECNERGLDPLNTNLVVADQSRTSKTICLAVSPALKSFGIPGRPRLFEVEQAVKKINRKRTIDAGYRMKGKSYYLSQLNKDPSLLLDYIVATPRMSLYMNYSQEIVETYMKYVSSQDIHVYSIDEVFIDVTDYLHTYKMNAHELAIKMIRDVMQKTGITATAGIGSNLYLAKVAMDIVAKHMPADEDGVRIAQLDEFSYRKQLWSHKPLTDFWRVGHGYMNRLEKYGLYTMGDIARFSLKNDGILYDEFGINAELLIDHAWGYEPCTMEMIKKYKPENNSLGSGQVLMEPYSYAKAMIVLKEMADALALDLYDKGLVTDHVSLYIGYDASNNLESFSGDTAKDYYGRMVAKHGGSSLPLKEYTSSSKILTEAFLYIYEHSINKKLMIRRINITADHVIPKSETKDIIYSTQLNLFGNPEEEIRLQERLRKEAQKDEKIQEAFVNIKKRFGKNAIFKATSMEEGATGKQRNEQIGGHRSDY